MSRAALPVRAYRLVANITQRRASSSFSRSNPSHLCPNQKLSASLVNFIDGFSRPITAVYGNDLWKVVFTCTGPFDPISTINIKSFSQYHSDLIAKDTMALALVPGTHSKVRRWLTDINKLTEEPTPVINLLERKSEDEVDAAYINLPVITDPRYKVHTQFGFTGSEERINNDATKEENRPQHHLLHIISPDWTIKYTQILPNSIGFNVLDIVRIIHGLQTAEDYDVLIPSEWTPGRDALMPIGRARDHHAAQSLKDDLAKQSGEDEEVIDAHDGTQKVAKKVDTAIIQEGDDDGPGTAADESERIPPGDVWHVLPYLQYVNIDKRIDNSSSVIGYQHMQAELFQKFDDFKRRRAEEEAGFEAKRKKTRKKGEQINSILYRRDRGSPVKEDDLKTMLEKHKLTKAEADEVLAVLNDDPTEGKYRIGSR